MHKADKNKDDDDDDGLPATLSRTGNSFLLLLIFCYYLQWREEGRKEGRTASFLHSTSFPGFPTVASSSSSSSSTSSSSHCAAYCIKSSVCAPLDGTPPAPISARAIVRYRYSSRPVTLRCDDSGASIIIQLVGWLVGCY